MNTRDDWCLIMTTCPDRDEAARLAGLLVEQRVAACVQVTDITSYYRWEGRVNREPESLLLIKTRTDRYDAVEKCIEEHHSYHVPEIIRLPVQGGLPAYLAWVDAQTAEG